jgi:hypothetical protein
MISSNVCDGEKAFGKLKDWCGNMGARMQPTGPNQHIPVADRSIRTLKNIARSIANNLPYVLPIFLIKWLLFSQSTVSIFYHIAVEGMVISLAQ